MATVSFHVGKTTSISHNNRENKYSNPDIDFERIKDNVIYVAEEIRELYKREFGEAVAEYNAKQKRADRKIDDYFTKVLHDKKTEHQREIIVAIGKGEDEIPKEQKQKILDRYMKKFQERNSNLKVYNAVLHNDEANPHLHINYVPIYESKRGLSKRVANNKALQEQGYESFEEWRNSETKLIEELMSEYDLKREFQGSHDYMRVSEYKEYAEELNELKVAKNELKNQVKELIPLKDEVVELQARKKGVQTVLEQKEKLLAISEEKMEVLSKLEKIEYSEAKYSRKDEKKLFGEKKFFEFRLTREQRDRLDGHLKSVSRHQTYNKPIVEENRLLRRENEKMENVISQNFKLQSENQTIKKQNQVLKERNQVLEKDFNSEVEIVVEKRYGELKKRNKDLDKQNFDLRKEILTLQREISKLRLQAKEMFEAAKEKARHEFCELAKRIPFVDTLLKEDEKQKAEEHKKQKEYERKVSVEKRIVRSRSRGYDMER